MPSAGNLSSSAGRISLAQRMVLSISAAPDGINAAKCSLVCITTRAMPMTPASSIDSRSSAYTLSPLPSGSRKYGRSSSTNGISLALTKASISIVWVLFGNAALISSSLNST